jgi:hypothetical protein
MEIIGKADLLADKSGLQAVSIRETPTHSVRATQAAVIYDVRGRLARIDFPCPVPLDLKRAPNTGKNAPYAPDTNGH